jgi:purine-binding chemotaxis protein CheW
MKKKEQIISDHISSAISSRLHEVVEKINLGLLSAADDKTLLQKRAKELAKVVVIEKQEEYLEYIKFGLANELFGIEKEYVKEVFPLKELTELPCVPNFVIGIINVRGKIISVIDLKRFFELPETGISDFNRVIILKENQLEFGILADRIYGVTRTYHDEMQKTLPTLKGIREEFLKGITNDRIVILDYKKLMNDNKLIVNEQVL